MDREVDMESEEAGGLSRRSLLRGSVIAGGALVWTAPVVSSMTRPAYASGSLPAMCGRFTGGGSPSVDTGNPHTSFSFTTGLELHCNPDDPRQNIEVTFLDCNGVTRSFHLDDVTTATCSLNGSPQPPNAPINQIHITGPGHLEPGGAPATIDATFVDNGEPGTNDTVSVRISYAGCSDFVSSGNLTRGNLQAHSQTGSKFMCGETT